MVGIKNKYDRAADEYSGLVLRCVVVHLNQVNCVGRLPVFLTLLNDLPIHGTDDASIFDS